LGKAEMNDKTRLHKFGEAIWRIVPLVVLVGILCVVLAPADSKTVKKVGMILIYCAGLPLLLGSIILLCERKGWLK
jgi:cell division protein FtsW (lipid II flippase)